MLINTNRENPVKSIIIPIEKVKEKQGVPDYLNITVSKEEEVYSNPGLDINLDGNDYFLKLDDLKQLYGFIKYCYGDE